MCAYSATTLSEMFKSGQLSASEIVENVFKQLEKHEPQVKAFLSLYKEEALEQAQELDLKRSQGLPLGKLAGVPVALKDNIHLKGKITTCASLFLSNYRAPFDSTVARLIQEEDGIIIGKTNLDEFAMGSSTEKSAFMTTHNPWDLTRSPGGSSGGSAAAVAARYVPLALGTDTGGSIRQPAALCGVVGFKPTYGRISRYGMVAFASSLDQIGPMSRSVEDSALMMEVLGKHCLHDATSLNLPPITFSKSDCKPPKAIGICSSVLGGLSSEMLNNFEESLNVFRKLGTQIIEVDLSLLNQSIAMYYILATAEASTNLARYDGIRYGLQSKRAQTVDEVFEFSRQEGFGWEVKNRILLGTYVLSSGYKDAYYKKAQKVRTLLIRQFKQAFEKCELIALPTSPTPAFKIGELADPIAMHLQDIYTISANLAGLPAISVPSGLSGEGLPLSLQLMGAQKDDLGVLSSAYLFEKEMGFNYSPRGYD